MRKLKIILPLLLNQNNIRGCKQPKWRFSVNSVTFEVFSRFWNCFSTPQFENCKFSSTWISLKYCRSGSIKVGLTWALSRIYLCENSFQKWAPSLNNGNIYFTDKLEIFQQFSPSKTKFWPWGINLKKCSFCGPIQKISKEDGKHFCESASKNVLRQLHNPQLMAVVFSWKNIIELQFELRKLLIPHHAIQNEKLYLVNGKFEKRMHKIKRQNIQILQNSIWKYIFLVRSMAFCVFPQLYLCSWNRGRFGENIL